MDTHILYLCLCCNFIPYYHINEVGPNYAGQAGLKFILLPQPPECLDYGHVSLCLACARILMLKLQLLSLK